MGIKFSTDPIVADAKVKSWEEYVLMQKRILCLENYKIPDSITDCIIEYAAFVIPGHKHFLGELKMSLVDTSSSIRSAFSDRDETRMIQAVLALNSDLTISTDDTESFYLDSSTDIKTKKASDKFRIISGTWTPDGKIEFGKTNVRSATNQASWLFKGDVNYYDSEELYRVKTIVTPAVVSTSLHYSGILDMAEAKKEKKRFTSILC